MPTRAAIGTQTSNSSSASRCKSSRTMQVEPNKGGGTIATSDELPFVVTAGLRFGHERRTQCQHVVQQCPSSGHLAQLQLTFTLIQVSAGDVDLHDSRAPPVASLFRSGFGTFVPLQGGLELVGRTEYVAQRIHDIAQLALVTQRLGCGQRFLLAASASCWIGSAPSKSRTSERITATRCKDCTVSRKSPAERASATAFRASCRARAGSALATRDASSSARALPPCPRIRPCRHFRHLHESAQGADSSPVHGITQPGDVPACRP